MEHIQMSEELRDDSQEFKDEINKRLLLIVQMQNASEVLCAEIEDLLEEKKKYRYDIKRNHKRIVELIKHQYMDVSKQLSLQEYSDFAEDNLELQQILNAWGGLDPLHRVALIETKDKPYKMKVNEVGDVFLRDEDGWVAHIPKAIADKMSIPKTNKYEFAKSGEIEVDSDIYIK